MITEDRLGELLMVGFFGQQLDEALVAHIREFRPAGLIFFKRNVISPLQLARLTCSIQNLALEELGRPLLLAIDQEGGPVSRLPSPFARLPDAVALGRKGVHEVSKYAQLTATELRLVGLNTNLAPVLDISDDTGFMYRRSYGNDPELVTKCGVAAIEATQSSGIIATAKHFPGLGAAQQDPHHVLPAVAASSRDLRSNHIKPFLAAVQCSVACIMTSHALYPSVDARFPGTFSPTILKVLLRQELGFAGVVITDDLEMGAVGGQYSLKEAAVAALRAGADLLLVCNDLAKMRVVAAAISEALRKGTLSYEELQKSLQRLELLRESYLHPAPLADLQEVRSYFKLQEE
ncbi:MAG: beta-N-acetylhexosaminidase [Deltaproteobacteria bacterium]|nr:beta-N-acetylhexosaminidase [Deltaproteobacteria bacterium]MBW2070164.1 beta-N-acetylhexosaminidase [Deltaproteobacteria bacterium]